MNAIERCLLYCDEVNPLSEQSRMDPRVLLAMNYLCRNLSRATKLSTVAAECRISVSRLAHLFREHSGQAPHQFLEMQRIIRAQQLLEMTEDPVATIASEVGFMDQFHFSHRFKHHLGLSRGTIAGICFLAELAWRRRPVGGLLPEQFWLSLEGVLKLSGS